MKQREIKFRAWEENDKRMFYDVTYNKDYTTGEHPWFYMQFTGFKDKNGKDIYEGDVLQIPKGNVYWEDPKSFDQSDWEDPLSVTWLNDVVVKWDEDGEWALFRRETDDFVEDRHPNTSMMDVSNCFIIGNIYEK